MEDYNRHRKDGIPYTVPLKTILIHASKANLWSRTPTGPTLESNLTNFLPSIKITKNFTKSLAQFINDSSFILETEKYVKAIENPCNKNELLLQNIQYFSRPHQNEHIIKLIQSPNIQALESKFLLSLILQRIESFEKYKHLDLYDLCAMIIQFYPFQDTHQLKFNLVLPWIEFNYQMIQSLKLVSTPLSTMLTSKEQIPQIYLSGFLTMDQKKRIMPLDIHDKLCLKYPLVGVWVARVEGEIHLNTNVWSTCIRFIETQTIHNKLSPCPESNCFLLVNFTPKPVFYEVSSLGKTNWCIITKILQPNINKIEFFNDRHLDIYRSKRKSLTASTSASEGKFSTFKPNLEMTSTEKIILKQNLMLKNLEKQINELQNVLSAERLVHSATNTTSLLNNPSSPDIQKKKKKKQVGKISENNEKSLKNNLLRSSCNIYFEKLSTEETFKVPKIIYQSENDSYEEEESVIERKYRNKAV